MKETKNLLFKKDVLQYSELMHKNFLCEEESSRYMLWRTTRSAEEAEIKISNWLQNIQHFWIVFEKLSNQPIGFVSAEHLQNKKYGEIGICVGTKFIKKGYGTEILTNLINFLKTLGADEIEYSYLEGNLVSKKLAEKFNFKYQEKRSRFVSKYNKSVNEYVYTLNI